MDADRRRTRRHGEWIVALAAAGALALYWWTAAPGLTWAHYGVDGGDLLAAAVSGGVPHPSGYPLYTMLLRLWLSIGAALFPTAEIAHLGNLLSALAAALSVGFTVAAAAKVIETTPGRWLLALTIGLLWAVSPLLWEQALITEVNAGQALLAAALGWALLVRPGQAGLLVLVIALGTAHHLTFLLLLPAAFYWLVANPVQRVAGLRAAAILGSGMALGALLYLRIPWAAWGGGKPPPVNWGYADNWHGFLWLVSGAAYRQYMFGLEAAGWLARFAAYARTLTAQFSAAGLAVAITGLAVIDRRQPVLRNFSLLWVVPMSIYAMAYATWDSEVYLLPVIWMMAMWLAVGLATIAGWLADRITPQLHRPWLVGAATFAGVILLAALRVSEISLANEHEAQDYLANAVAAVQPGSLVVSSADAETFALWYGAWASGELLRAAPGIVLVNYSLYQFDWYRRLLRDFYPDAPSMGEPFAELLAASAAVGPVYIADPLPTDLPGHLTPVGRLWRYTTE